ncbi:DEKNAAC103387 [Brettanomyces naardenensis]|uniref:DEKNAAC103387 n=1 Tax=Brettanomyces naardenensis TaxID=13370 RepID=A0A448YNZ1_BRENA|nr:DEKNAAC103387 [Brettanomyces naardenensis]
MNTESVTTTPSRQVDQLVYLLYVLRNGGASERYGAKRDGEMGMASERLRKVGTIEEVDVGTEETKKQGIDDRHVTSSTPSPSHSPAPFSLAPATARVKQWLALYSKAEDRTLGLLETLITQFDNFVLLQTFIPRLRQSQDSRLGRLINFTVRQLSKFYLIVIAINVRKLLVRLIRVNRLIKRLELECRILNSQILIDTEFKIPKQLKECLVKLYTAKVKTIIELVGYLNELLLNVNIIWGKKVRLPKRLKQAMSVVGWIIGIYRLSQEEGEEERVDLGLKGMEEEYL